MPPAPPEARPERDSTDRSLAGEREKTDDELMKRGAVLEESSDEVIARARGQAGQVLEEARRTADAKLRETGASGAEQAVVDEDRQREDRALRAERATADASLEEERQTRRRALAALLAVEREETDEHLLLERSRADSAVHSRDEFLAIVTHDVRNLLGGLVMSASSVMNVPCEDAAKEAIAREGHRIQRYAARMNRLVADLLDVVSIEAGRLAVVPEREDAKELLRETVDAFEALIASRKISMRTEVKAGTLLARYDHERVLQVLANLVGNAIKFTPDGGRIDLVVEALDGEIRFGVVDTGAGIPEDRLTVVFDRYWQRAKHQHGGLGLGLYIARSIVEAHGGRIWAESRLGEGSTFYFTLPAAPGA
ncbi:MAG: hypothetical protein JWP97_2822 [Labilithrix sp.]|nr:hypothetical protein [Labilithrix sp.]